MKLCEGVLKVCLNIVECFLISLVLSVRCWVLGFCNHDFDSVNVGSLWVMQKVDHATHSFKKMGVEFEIQD